MQEIGSEEALERELELVQRAELDEIFDQSEAARKLLRGSGISVHADHLLGAKKILKDRSGAENRHLVTQEEEITGKKSGLRQLMDALEEEED